MIKENKVRLPGRTQTQLLNWIDNSPQDFKSLLERVASGESFLGFGYDDTHKLNDTYLTIVKLNGPYVLIGYADLKKDTFDYTKRGIHINCIELFMRGCIHHRIEEFGHWMAIDPDEVMDWFVEDGS